VEWERAEDTPGNGGGVGSFTVTDEGAACIDGVLCLGKSKTVVPEIFCEYTIVL
jgi:hypothetical protein